MTGADVLTLKRAVCGKAARTDPGGARSVMGASTRPMSKSDGREESGTKILSLCPK